MPVEIDIIKMPRRRRPILIDPEALSDLMTDCDLTLHDVATRSGLDPEELAQHFYNGALPEDDIDAIREATGIDVPIDLDREREQVAAAEADLFRLRLDLDDIVKRLEQSEEQLRATSSALRRAIQRRRGNAG